MQPTDGDRFRNLLRGMGRTLGSEPDNLVLDAYWIALRDWSLDDFEAACGLLMKTSKWMPKPAEFEALRKAGRPTVGEAWIKARQNASTAIVCGQVTQGRGCGEPLIDSAVRAIGGYGAIAMCDSDKLGFLERRFAEHFSAMQEVQDTREAVPQIASTEAPRRLSGPRRLLG
jgi:hypothetical protein